MLDLGQRVQDLFERSHHLCLQFSFLCNFPTLKTKYNSCACKKVYFTKLLIFSVKKKKLFVSLIERRAWNSNLHNFFLLWKRQWQRKKYLQNLSVKWKIKKHLRFYLSTSEKVKFYENCCHLRVLFFNSIFDFPAKLCFQSK